LVKILEILKSISKILLFYRASSRAEVERDGQKRGGGQKGGVIRYLESRVDDVRLRLIFQLDPELEVKILAP
jgi:hypothetical protein